MLLLKKEVRPSGVYKHSVVSRVSLYIHFIPLVADLCTPIIPQPIPVEYLRLGSFDAVPENRKDKSSGSVDHGKLFAIDSFRSRYRAMYPFTLYHASAVTTRRYTLYANSEQERGKWRAQLEEAMSLRKIRQDSNMVSSGVKLSQR